MTRDDKGYNLVELVVVMAIFAVVMTLITVSFNRIVSSSSGIVRSVETDIGGLIGLELLRLDLELAGLGLPWSLSGVTYQETTHGEMVSGYAGTRASSYNDPPPTAPRAFASGNDAGYNGSDYLVLKGTAVGMSRTARGWSYLNYSSGGVVIKPSKSEVELLPGKNERTIVLRSGVRSGVPVRELVTAGPGSQVFTLFFNTPLPEGFRPRKRGENYLVYGVAPPGSDEDEETPGNQYAPLRFPFNRADYYLSPNQASRSCAAQTGVLYKATVNHGGGVNSYPILDCVADLQATFMMQTSDDGSLVPTPDISGFTVEEIRELLKEVRVYVLAQEGKVDPGYSFPMAGPELALRVGERNWSKDQFRANNWLHYRWKVYSIVVQPKNL